MQNFCPKVGIPIEFERRTKSYKGLDKIRSASLDDYRQCWSDMRASCSELKEITPHAYANGWLELPDHISYKLELGDRREKKIAQHAAEKYYSRTSFDKAVFIAKKITLGSVFRLPTEYDFGDINGFGIEDLNNAAMSKSGFESCERLLLDERLTTGYHATYIFNSSQSGDITPTIKHYCAENIIDLKFDAFECLQYILFREFVEQEQDEFGQSDEVYRFRELRLIDGQAVERIWQSTDDDDFEAPEDAQSVIIIRGQALNELPVVIEPEPPLPPFLPLQEACRDLYNVQAKIDNRHQKIGHPTLWLNYQGGPRESFIATGDERGENFQETFEPHEKDDQPIVPGIMFETQNAQVSYIVDDGGGIDHLINERDRIQDNLERLGGNYGITKTASNVSEAVETMRQGRESAFIISNIIETSNALTQIARWVAFFSGVPSELLNDIQIRLNTELTDGLPQFAIQDVINLVNNGLIGLDMAIRLLRLILPASIFDDMSDDQIIANMNDLEFANSFGVETTAQGLAQAVNEIALDSNEPVVDASSEALNGAQVASLVQLLNQVALDTLPEATVLQIIRAAFPRIPDESVQAILAPLRTFTPAAET